jgi:hypothetical protein
MTSPLPGIDKKKMYLIVGGVVVLGGFAYYRHKKAATAAAATTGTGIDNTQVDPATGFPYGSTQDAAALAAETAYQTPNSYGYGSTGSGSLYGYGTSSQFINNQDWEQAAITFLVNTVGAPSGDVSAALGRYLTGGQASAQDQSYIEQAIAAEGYPPVSGNNGYPPSVKTGGTTGTTTTPTPPPTTTTPNPVVHETYAVQYHQISVETGGRPLVTRFSYTGATPNAIESALQQTVNDSRNTKYRAYFGSHNGSFPAKAGVWVTTVQKG